MTEAPKKRTFIVATNKKERSNVIAKLKEVDPNAFVTTSQNPCNFFVTTIVSHLTIDCMAGVAHVIERK